MTNAVNFSFIKKIKGDLESLKNAIYSPYSADSLKEKISNILIKLDKSDHFNCSPCINENYNLDK